MYFQLGFNILEIAFNVAKVQTVYTIYLNHKVANIFEAVYVFNCPSIEQFDIPLFFHNFCMLPYIPFYLAQHSFYNISI